jgi:hypothetical protein
VLSAQPRVPSPSPRARWGRRAWLAGAAALGLAAAGVLARPYDASYPIGSWLCWRYAQLWLWLLLFNAACASFGQLLLVRVLRRPDLPALESAVTSMILGTVAFVIAMYIGGAVGAFHPVFGVLLPVAFLAAGLPHGLALWRRLRAELRGQPFGVLAGAAGVAGLLYLGLMYLRVLSPDALGYDAVWLHVKIAQDYARWGRIRPFPGDYSHALPHLASILYTWGYLLPGLYTAQRWIFAMHMELCIALWTLAGISALVARLVPPPAVRSGWAAYFLFPGFFLVGLWGTADHIVALYSIGMALAVLQLFARPAPAAFALLAISVAGGVLTKYQAVYVAAPALALAALAWGLGWLRLRRAGRAALADAAPPVGARELWRGPIVLAALGAVLVAPHFVKNLIFHHNPVYPFAQQLFRHSTPAVPDGWIYFEHGMKPGSGTPERFADKLRFVFHLLTTVSLQPRVWDTGICSIFVLLLPAAALPGRRREALVVAALGVGSLFMWAMLLVESRHLETFTPLLAAGVAAAVVKLWRLGLPARIGLVPLLAVQIAWAADAPFSDMARGALDAGLRVIAAGLAKRGTSLFGDFRAGYVALGKAVPRNAKLVIHTFGVSLGINRDIVMDSIGFQGLISYRPLRTPRELYDRFHALGITHLVHEPNGPYPSPTKQEDVLFFALASRWGRPVGRFEHLFLTAMPDRPPPVEAPYKVLALGLPDYPDGLYRIEELSDWIVLPPDRKERGRPDRPATPDNQVDLLQVADAVLCGPPCRLPPAAAARLDQRFQRIDNRISHWLLYLKK